MGFCFCFSWLATIVTSQRWWFRKTQIFFQNEPLGLSARRCSMSQLSWIRGEKFLTVSRLVWKKKTKVCFLGTDSREWGLCSPVQRAPCLFCSSRLHFWAGSSTYIPGNIFIFYSCSILGLSCICYTWIFISCTVLLCISHALLFCLGLHRTGCPTKLICPIITLEILD